MNIDDERKLWREVAEESHRIHFMLPEPGPGPRSTWQFRMVVVAGVLMLVGIIATGSVFLVGIGQPEVAFVAIAIGVIAGAALSFK